MKNVHFGGTLGLSLDLTLLSGGKHELGGCRLFTCEPQPFLEHWFGDLSHFYWGRGL